MRVHLLSLPNTQPTAGFELDGFCTRTLLFAELLKRLGHTVVLYGVETTTAACDAFVVCVTEAERVKLLGGVAYQAFVPDANHQLCLTFNVRASNHLRGIKQPGDVIATIGGSAQHFVWESHPELTFLEYSIGYRGITAPYRIFQSHAWRHVVHGFTGVDGGRLLDAVIPPFFPVDAFPFVARPDPYVVYCGRLVPSKGITTACDAAKAAGVKLVVIGHGDPALVTYGEFLGAVTTEERNRILSRARACLMPTQYIEPFGNVAAEAQLCGTPVISTDFGAFTESVDHGVSGYRCTSLGEFVQAIHLAPDLDRVTIRQRAESLYSMDAAAVAYRSYFRRLTAVDGWRSLEPGLEALTERVGYESRSLQSVA